MATPEQVKAFKDATRGQQKKRFASKSDEKQRQIRDALSNAAQRRAGISGGVAGNNRRGSISGGGTGAAASFAANSKGRFIPRTATGRPAGDGAGPPDRVLGGPGSKNGQPLRRGFGLGKK